MGPHRRGYTDNHCLHSLYNLFSFSRPLRTQSVSNGIKEHFYVMWEEYSCSTSTLNRGALPTSGNASCKTKYLTNGSMNKLKTMCGEFETIRAICWGSVHINSYKISNIINLCITLNQKICYCIIFLLIPLQYFLYVCETGAKPQGRIFYAKHVPNFSKALARCVPWSSDAGKWLSTPCKILGWCPRQSELLHDYWIGKDAPWMWKSNVTPKVSETQ